MEKQGKVYITGDKHGSFRMLFGIAEKKLLQQYRKADDLTKKAVDNILAAVVPSSGKSEAGGDLLNSLLGNVLEQLMGKK